MLCPWWIHFQFKEAGFGLPTVEILGPCLTCHGKLGKRVGGRGVGCQHPILQVPEFECDRS